MSALDGLDGHGGAELSDWEGVDGGGHVVWPAFGDLMACLFGLFVLFFSWMVMSEITLNQDLMVERKSLEEAEAKLAALESALSGPLKSGLITLVDGRIGIRGSVLFASNSATLRARGQGLIEELGPPLATFLREREVAIMVSGFTDDKPLSGFGEFQDNWELSSQRALTVTRALVQAGIPARWVIAAGFGEHHPVVENDSDEHRAMNRRVEISWLPRPTTVNLAGPGAGTPEASAMDAVTDATLADAKMDNATTTNVTASDSTPPLSEPLPPTSAQAPQHDTLQLDAQDNAAPQNSSNNVMAEEPSDG